MCLTGVDYFSTLGYQPGIAALAAGALSPDRHADPGAAHAASARCRSTAASPRESPHGEGSIAMLERLLPWWQGKLFVLVPARLRRHRLHHHDHPLGRRRHRPRRREPVRPRFLHGHEVVVTLVLIALLGAVFLKGFREAIGIAVALVGGLPRAQRRRRRRSACTGSPRIRTLLGDWQARALRRARQPAG